MEIALKSFWQQATEFLDRVLMAIDRREFLGNIGKTFLSTLIKPLSASQKAEEVPEEAYVAVIKYCDQVFDQYLHCIQESRSARQQVPKQDWRLIPASDHHEALAKIGSSEQGPFSGNALWAIEAEEKLHKLNLPEKYIRAALDNIITEGVFDYWSPEMFDKAFDTMCKVSRLSSHGLEHRARVFKSIGERNDGAIERIISDLSRNSPHSNDRGSSDHNVDYHFVDRNIFPSYQPDTKFLADIVGTSKGLPRVDGNVLNLI